MNRPLLAIVKRIIAGEGEAVLADPARLKALFKQYAKDEPKDQCLAFGRCIEQGCYAALKKAGAADGRAGVKAELARRVSGASGLDVPSCAAALDLLEAAVWGDAAAGAAAARAGTAAGAAALGKPAFLSGKIPVFGAAGALGGLAGESVSNFFGLNNGTWQGGFGAVVLQVAIWAALAGLGISSGLLAAQHFCLRKKPDPRSFLKTALLGVLTGAAAGALAQILFTFTWNISTPVEIVSRIFAWGVMGGGAGRGAALFVPNYPKKRAIPAGFLGGLAGGAVFRSLFFLPDPAGRIAGIMILGLCIGLAVSCAEEMLREAWLTVVWGPRETAAVSLGGKPVTFGSSPGADIHLPRGELPVRAEVRIENARVVLYDKSSGRRTELGSGSRVDLGRVHFIVNTKR
jgi:hypothetical protein